MSSLNCNFPFSDLISIRVYVVVSMLFLILFVFSYVKIARRSRVGDLGVFLIVVGALANAFERFYSGCVLDNLDFFGLFFFNIQDFLVTTGIILTLWSLWRTK